MDFVETLAQLLRSMPRQEDETMAQTNWLSDDLHPSPEIQALAASGSSISTSDTMDPLQTCRKAKKKSKKCTLHAAQIAQNQAEDSSRLSSGSSPPVSTFWGADSLDAPGSVTLEELVDRLKLRYFDSNETNNVAAAIITHPDLMKNTSTLNVYSKLNGGLKHSPPGQAHAWLYTPKKRKRNPDFDSDPDDAFDSTALVLVYPEVFGPSSCNDDDSKSNFNFGGRAHTFRNGSERCVRIQHGSCRALGLKARKFQLVGTDKRTLTNPRDASCNVDDKELLSSSSHELNFKQLRRMPRAVAEEPVLDERFDADVESVRMGLKGNDLKCIHAVLMEVWNQEVADHGAPAQSLLA